MLPKLGSRTDGDLGLTTLSEAAFGAASFHPSSAYWQTYIIPSSSLVMVPGVHLMPLRAW